MPPMQTADDTLRALYSELLGRFYRVFESIHRYVTDLKRFIQDLDEGGFIQTSLESVFLDEDGKQLLVIPFTLLSQFKLLK
jgi:WASH complex subunit strumpellin